MKKNDNILILGILFIALVVLGIQLLHSANGTEKVKITVDGKVFGTYLLSEDRTVSVNETNIVLITEGTVQWSPLIVRIRFVFTIRGSKEVEKVLYVFRIKSLCR